MAKSHQCQRHYIPEVRSYKVDASSMADPSNRGPGAASRQAAVLRREGVTVETGHLRELTIDFNTFGWFPAVLPSKETRSSEGG